MRNYTIKEMAQDMVPMILAQWKKSKLSFVPPVNIGEVAVATKVDVLWKRFYSTARGNGKAGERMWVEESLDKLFDIVKCTHPILICQEEGSGCAGVMPQCAAGCTLSAPAPSR